MNFKLQSRIRGLRGDGSNYPWEEATAGYMEWYEKIPESKRQRLQNGEILKTVRFGGLLEEEVRMLKAEDIAKMKYEELFARFNVRLIGYGTFKDAFGDEITFLSPHLNDLRFANSDGLFKALEENGTKRVGYVVKNNQIQVKEV